VSLLELEHVGKRYRDGQLERVVLREVSLQLESGELTVVWGLRRSGRSTLLRVAAGIEAPDTGVVRFAGRDLAVHGEEVLGAGVGYVQKTLGYAGSQLVIDEVMVSLLARGVPPERARSRASEALKRAGADGCFGLRLAALDVGETVRVALARVLALGPRLLVVDEPVQGVDLLERDGILMLLRSLADDGMAVLASTSESTGLAGADRTLTLSEGDLRGPPARELASVLPLRRSAARRAGA
jgi:energy-coupling factor transporter ATP-binding protein EcfA2